jgi:oligopeptide/dipeptide ABC transporter ATP-binding protein
MNTPLPVRVERLRISFPGGTSPLVAVDDLSFSLARGDTLGIVGESGSGKSVTALALMGLLPAKSAQVTAQTLEVAGLNLLTATASQWRTLRRDVVGMVFQDPMTALTPTLRIGAQLAEALRPEMAAAERRRLCIQALVDVGIREPERQLRAYPHELSGGMRQRVLIAMALLGGPTVLLADEPTTALDTTVQAQILALLSRAQRERGLAMLFISHDLAVVRRVAERAMVMYAGRVAERGPVETLLTRSAHPYTRGLIRSIPPLSGAIPERLPTLPGAPPDPRNRPTGCAFHPRCAWAIPRCAQELPAPLKLSPGHASACFRAAEVAQTQAG